LDKTTDYGARRIEEAGARLMNHNRVRDIFTELVANCAPKDWDTRLYELAGDDDDLFRHVQRLLAAHRQTLAFNQPSKAPTLVLRAGRPCRRRRLLCLV
jgi:hypothetical protein